MFKDIKSMWELVSDDPAEVAILKKKSDTMISILIQAKERGVGKASLKQMANLSFQECNALYRGEMDKLSLERVREVADRVGFDPRYIETLRSE